jgi:hypothetical protein
MPYYYPPDGSVIAMIERVCIHTESPNPFSCRIRSWRFRYCHVRTCRWRYFHQGCRWCVLHIFLKNNSLETVCFNVWVCILGIFVKFMDLPVAVLSPMLLMVNFFMIPPLILPPSLVHPASLCVCVCTYLPVSEMRAKHVQNTG